MVHHHVTGLVAGVAAAGLVWASSPPGLGSFPTADEGTAPVTYEGTAPVTYEGTAPVTDEGTALAEAPTEPAVPEDLPDHVHGGAWPTSHVQGIALDRESGHMYWSFTQMLVKTDLEGEVVGTVEGITGHLGSLDRNPDDGRIVGSLEYKDDEAFYVALFDGDRIDRVGMDAASDGVMTTVHLQEVVDDYTAEVPTGDPRGTADAPAGTANTPGTRQTTEHRYGCSGIDGLSFGPAFGDPDSAWTLKVAYGVFSDTERSDNDHQVIVEYDVSDWERYEEPLDEDDPHRSGPEDIEDKYFVYTGNTTYGVQNLEYDPHTGHWMMAVYEGEKEEFPNYSFYVVDGAVEPERGEIVGQPEPEEGLLLSLLEDGLYDEESGVYGWEFHGQFGLESVGDGYFYAADGGEVDDGGVPKQDADAHLYRWTGEAPTPFEPVSTD